jgi:4-hydroxy-tetrahydrodipicolinate synthase
MTGNITPAEPPSRRRGRAMSENFKTSYLKLLPLLHFTYSAINPVGRPAGPALQV